MRILKRKVRVRVLAVLGYMLVCAGAHALHPVPGDIYQPANQCFTIRAAAAADPGGYLVLEKGKWSLAGEAGDAARIYFKPTALGSYLLLAGYAFSETAVGSKELLGLTDPGGELLDAAGNALVEGGENVGGVGDVVDGFIDPVTPGGRLLRQAGENVGEAGVRLADRDVQPALTVTRRANDLAVWRLARLSSGSFEFSSQVTGQKLARGADDGLVLAPAGGSDAATRFSLLPASGCDAYPEAPLNAELAAPDVHAAPANFLREVPDLVPGADEDDIFGFVDAHAHVSAYEFIGGRINYGDPFHKFGVEHALEDCAENHGPQGSTGTVEMVTSGPSMTGHETRGWPTFGFWPRNNSLQHHQSYWRWIERAHLAGQKILVNHLVHNEILCQLVPQKQNDCDAMPAIELQAYRMHQMQDYIDAHAGGPGKGFFRIVTSPAEARRVIAAGHMAVLLGVEMSKVLNCGEFLDQPECTRGQVIERLDRLQSLGVVSLFPVHKFDNAFGGHRVDSGGPGISTVLYAGNFAETGHPIEYEECSETDAYTPEEIASTPPGGILEQLFLQGEYPASYFPPSGQAQDPRKGTRNLCNARGLTDLGRMLIDELMRRKMFIETDHISQKALNEILDITGARSYPVVNSHGGWGGNDATLDRITALGGSSHTFAGSRDGFLNELIKYGSRPSPARLKVGGIGGTGFASDVNGIAPLAGVATEASPIYPFTSVDGRVVFSQQVTGLKTFHVNEGRGVAHYGLYPDMIADALRNAQVGPQRKKQAMQHLFVSAEAYIRMWEHMVALP